MSADDLFDEAQFRPTPADALPAADLTELMAQAATSPTYQLEFYRRLLVEPLAVLVADLPEDWEAGSQELLPLTPLLLPSGELPVFTSLDTLFANPDLRPETTRYAFVNGRELLTAVQNEAVVLNPFSTPNLLFTPAFIAQLLSGGYVRQGLLGGELTPAEEAEEATIGAVPAEYEALAAQVAAQLILLLGQQPRVRLAYLLWQHSDGTGSPPCFLVLLVLAGEGERLVQEMAYVARNLLQPARLNLKIMTNEDPAAFQPYADQLRIEPFYQD